MAVTVDLKETSPSLSILPSGQSATQTVNQDSNVVLTSDTPRRRAESIAGMWLFRSQPSSGENYLRLASKASFSPSREATRCSPFH
jgi:hypothetical protein